jgi:hypothetical protein
VKFKDKLELAQLLKKTIDIKPFVVEAPNATVVRPTPRYHYVPMPAIPSPLEATPVREEKVTYINTKTREQVEEEFKERAAKFKAEADKLDALLEQELEEVPSAFIPGITNQFCPPSPSDTKILVDGELVNNIYSVDYAYLYDIDDRTLEQRINGVPEDVYHVIGWLTILFNTPAEAATFDCDSIRLVNVNSLGQSFDFTIVEVKTVAEAGGVNMNDAYMTKVVFFEARDIIGRVII